MEGTQHMLRGICSGSLPSFLLCWRRHGSPAISILAAQIRTIVESHRGEAGSLEQHAELWAHEDVGTPQPLTLSPSLPWRHTLSKGI